MSAVWYQPPFPTPATHPFSHPRPPLSHVLIPPYNATPKPNPAHHPFSYTHPPRLFSAVVHPLVVDDPRKRCVVTRTRGRWIDSGCIVCMSRCIVKTKPALFTADCFGNPGESTYSNVLLSAHPTKRLQGLSKKINPGLRSHIFYLLRFVSYESRILQFFKSSKNVRNLINFVFLFFSRSYSPFYIFIILIYL